MKKYAIMFLIGLSISLPAHASYHQNLSQIHAFQAWARPQKTSHQNGAASPFSSDPRPVRPPSFPSPLCSAQPFPASQIMELSFCLPKGPWLPGSNDLRGYFVTTGV